MALRVSLLVLLLLLSYQPSLSQSKLSQSQRREVRLEIQPRLKREFGLGYPTSVISPNDKLMLVGGLFAFVWELATEREIVRFDGHRGNVTAVIFSPDGETAFTAGTDETVRAWSIKTGREILKLDVQSGHVEALAISPDSRLLITHGLGDSEAQVWDLSSRRLLRTLSLPSSARSSATVGFDSHVENPEIAGPFAFSANGNRVLSGANDRIVRLLDLKTGTVLRALEGPAYNIEYVALSFDARWALIGSYSGQVLLFDLTTGKPVKRFFHGARYHDVCFSEDRQAVLYKSSGTILAWELSTQKETEVPPGRALCQYHSYTFRGSSVSRDLSFYANELDSVRYTGREAAGRKLRQGAGNIDDVWISSDGRWMRTNFPGDGFGIPTTWSLWDTTAGQPVYISTDRATHSYPFSVNGSVAVTADLEQLIFWENGQITRDFKINSTHPTGRTVLSKDGKRALSWVLNLSGLESITQLWDVETGTELRKFSSPISPNNLAALSSNGKLVLMTFVDGVVMGVVILDADTGQELKRLLTTRLPDSLAVSNDDKYVLTTEQQWVDVGGGVGEPTDGLLRLWDLRNGRELRHFQVRGAKAKMVANFSPDGKWVTAKDERIVEIFEASTGRSVWWFDRLDRGVASALSNDGRHLLLVDRTDRVRVIDIQSGVEVATIVSTERGGWAVVSRDGRFDTNRAGLEGMMPLQWIVDDDPLHALPVEIFMRTHYQPQLLAQILAGESLPPLPDISSLNRAQPEVTITQVKSTPKDPSRADVTIEVKEATYLGKKSGAQEVRLFRDGRLVGLKEGNILPGNDDRVQLRFEAIQLPSNGPKRITFSAYAFNNDRVKSETAYQTFERPFQDPKKRRAYLVAIGINETPKIPGLRLQFAANDARLLSNELKGRVEQQGTYESVSVSILISDTGKPLGATKALIKKELEDLARVVRPEDFVLMSYSGHGYASDGMFHIFPSDISPGQSLMPAGSISTTELAEWLRGIDAEQMVLIIDACHSAASVEAGGFKPGPMGDVGLGQLAYDKRMRILGASQAADVAIEDQKLKQSLLTYALVQEGLNQDKADWRPSDNIIRLDEWLQYAVQRVPNLNRELESRNLRRVLPRSLDLHEKSLQAPALFDFTDGVVNDVILSKVK